MALLGYLYWDPSPYIISTPLPILGRPILWYGLFFALGFFLGYIVFKYLLSTFLLTRPYFSKEDIVDPWKIEAICKEKKEAHCLHTIAPGTGSKDRLQVFWSEQLNKKLDSTKTPGINLEQVRCIQNFIKRLPSHLKELLSKRMFLQRLFHPAVSNLRHKAKLLSEKVTFAAIIGAVIGARLGDVFFYQSWQQLSKDPFLVFKVWEGGLASHGGAIGVIIAIGIISYHKECKAAKLSFLRILDLSAIPTTLVAGCIRIGNFVNQEILGTPSTMPWAVVFGHPADGSAPVPRHPVQLYECISYLLLGTILFLYWKRCFQLKRPGQFFGGFLTVMFLLRFVWEFFKTEQSIHISASSYITMGQYLSLPFIALGLFLLFRNTKKL